MEFYILILFKKSY